MSGMLLASWPVSASRSSYVCGGCVGCGVGGWESYSGREHLVFGVFVVFWVFKGVRWMPWCSGPRKDVAACDMPRGVGKRALIRGFPNGVTWPGLCPVAAV